MSSPTSDASPASEIPATEAVVATEAVPTLDANSAVSSAADSQDAKQAPANLLDVVRDVVAKPQAPEGSSPAEAEPEKQAEVEAKADGEGDAEADLPFHNHPRFKALIEERNSLRDSAQSYEAITGFMQQHGLVGREVAEGFEVMALLKSGQPDDLKRVLEWMEPNVAWLREQLGEVLPDDLRTKVEDGLVDADIAKELARARASTALTAEQQARSARDAEQAEIAAAAQTRATVMVSAVTGWEERTRKADPDYAKKEALVETHARALVQKDGKPPTTAEEAIALVERAYAEVNATFRSMLPKPKPLTPAPTGMSASVATAPQTLRQAVEAGLRRSA